MIKVITRIDNSTFIRANRKLSFWRLILTWSRSDLRLGWILARTYQSHDSLNCGIPWASKTIALAFRICVISVGGEQFCPLERHKMSGIYAIYASYLLLEYQSCVLLYSKWLQIYDKITIKHSRGTSTNLMRYKIYKIFPRVNDFTLNIIYSLSENTVLTYNRD